MIEYLKDKYYWFKTYNKLNLFLKDKESPSKSCEPAKAQKDGYSACTTGNDKYATAAAAVPENV